MGPGPPSPGLAGGPRPPSWPDASSFPGLGRRRARSTPLPLSESFRRHERVNCAPHNLTQQQSHTRGERCVTRHSQRVSVGRETSRNTQSTVGNEGGGETGHGKFKGRCPECTPPPRLKRTRVSSPSPLLQDQHQGGMTVRPWVSSWLCHLKNTWPWTRPHVSANPTALVLRFQLL